MWPSPSGRDSYAKHCTMEGASCNVAESQWERNLREVLLRGRSKLQCARVPVREALARSVTPWEEQAARWPSPSGRDTCAKRCSMGGASCKVAESPWKRHLRDVLLHGRNKLQGGRVPVGEVLARSCVPWAVRALMMVHVLEYYWTLSVARLLRRGDKMAAVIHDGIEFWGL
ncbi:hypothetical protein Adt_41957 [Abeliophyllum distichum]|uniref:Uncharacterized protein n=1 Tax=Abeliophyllum distichum TaxID=126358 RepID=A0ABD1PUA1_9LAMI